MHPALKATLFKGGDPTLLWDEDYVNGVYRYNRARYPAVTDLPATTFTRATTKTARTSAGAVQSFAPGTLAATDAGASIEAAATNVVLRSDPLGAVAGSPGTAPTGWAILNFGTVNGVTRSIAGAGTDPTTGLPYVDISFVGTFTAPESPTITAGLGVNPGYAASSSQAWSASMYWAVVAGVLPAPAAAGINGVRLRYNNSGSLLSQTGSSDTPNTTFKNRQSVTVSAPASTTGVGVDWLWSFGAGQAINVTLRFAAHQLELGSFATSYIPTTTVAVSRNADALATADTAISPTIVAEFNVPLTGVSYANVWQHDDGTDATCAALYFNRLLGKLYLVVAVSGVNQALLDLGAATAGSTYKVAARIATNDFAASKGGAACVTDVSGSLPAVTTFRRGRGVAAGAEWGSGIRKIKRYSVAKTNAELQALST